MYGTTAPHFPFVTDELTDTVSAGDFFNTVSISLNSFSIRSIGTHPRSQASDLRASSDRFFNSNQCGLSGTKKSADIDRSGKAVEIAAIVLHFRNVPRRNCVNTPSMTHVDPVAASIPIL